MAMSVDANVLTKSHKFWNLLRAQISSKLAGTPAFVRIIPTDRCNLNCQYCWQKDNNSSEMTLAAFRRYADKAKKLRVGLITFLGGEPMLWAPLYDAIAECSRRGILTDMTTNGTLLTVETIQRLGQAGLDYLNISVDGTKQSSVSMKDSVIRNDLFQELKNAKREYGMHSRLNSVIYRDNFEEIKRLLELAHENDMQISLGYVVPPIESNSSSDRANCFSLEDSDRLAEIVKYLVEKKRAGYPIIDPESYFENIFAFLRKEKFWDCNYPTRYGWVNVAPTGHVRSCTKKMDELDFQFLELNTTKLRELKSRLRVMVNECNVGCYSNCAYDSYFYTHHKWEMVRKIVRRVRRRREVRAA